MRKQIKMNLKERRKQWEQGAHLLHYFDFMDNINAIVTITESNGTYRVIRYFEIVDGWVASVDVESEDMNDVMKAIDFILRQ